MKKILVKRPVPFYKNASNPEEWLQPGAYTVKPDPGGAGYGGQIDQTHWLLTREEDGIEVCVPVNSYEQQIEASPDVEIVEEELTTSTP